MPQRRMQDRYRPVGSAFVIFESPRPYDIGNPKIIQLGPITEISPQGLSVEFLFHKDCQKDFQELSLLVPGQGLLVYRIPFQNISETIVSTTRNQQPIMRRGIRFKELDKHHAGQLEAFIATYTRGNVPDRRSGYERRHMPQSDAPAIAASGNKEIDPRRSGKDRRNGPYSSA